MILVSGFNVYPSEIEEVIAKHPKYWKLLQLVFQMKNQVKCQNSLL